MIPQRLTGLALHRQFPAASQSVWGVFTIRIPGFFSHWFIRRDGKNFS